MLLLLLLSFWFNINKMNMVRCGLDHRLSLEVVLLLLPFWFVVNRVAFFSSFIIMIKCCKD